MRFSSTSRFWVIFVCGPPKFGRKMSVLAPNIVFFPGFYVSCPPKSAFFYVCGPPKSRKWPIFVFSMFRFFEVFPRPGETWRASADPRSASWIPRPQVWDPWVPRSRDPRAGIPGNLRGIPGNPRGVWGPPPPPYPIDHFLSAVVPFCMGEVRGDILAILVPTFRFDPSRKGTEK